MLATIKEYITSTNLLAARPGLLREPWYSKERSRNIKNSTVKELRIETDKRRLEAS